MSIGLVIPALIAVAALGWLGGMLTLKRSQRWCPRCGTALQCPDCHRAGLHVTTGR